VEKQQPEYLRSLDTSGSYVADHTYRMKDSRPVSESSVRALSESYHKKLFHEENCMNF
jgi:hypothetical protein